MARAYGYVARKKKNYVSQDRVRNIVRFGYIANPVTVYILKSVLMHFVVIL